MAPPKLILPFPDYCRIFRTIYSTLEGRAHVHVACKFFALAGALLLERHYKRNATPVAGTAVFLLDASESLALRYGSEEQADGGLSGDFHCWVQCEGYAIDFMAPIFQESLAHGGHRHVVPRKMFQRALSAQAPHVDELRREGDFALFPNKERTLDLTTNFSQLETDLANVCIDWYRRPPKRMASAYHVRDERNQIHTIELKSPDVIGVW